MNTTYTGAAITPLETGLPKSVQSICPECGRTIQGALVAEDGRVFMNKSCPRCGGFLDLISSSAGFYLRMERWALEDGRGVANPAIAKSGECPASCGLCPSHTSHAVVGLVDLTNRCNLRCPICFANADVSGYQYQPSLDAVRKMLETLRDMRPVPCRILQFSGGEPTLHPEFHEAVRLARQLGFSQIQVATNGIRFAESDFAHRASEAGLDLLYLQFDGVGDDIYLRTRGARLWEQKLR